MISEFILNLILAAILIASGYAAGYTHMRHKHDEQVKGWAEHAARADLRAQEKWQGFYARAMAERTAPNVARSATARRSPAHRAPSPASPEGTN